MAGDWIKMTHELSDKPEVIAMSASLGMDRFAVVGRLHRIWGWFDRHTTDGNAAGVTPAFVDSLVAHEGFARSMTDVGWLAHRNGRLIVPNFDRHISKSAKQRALGSERAQRSRNATSVTKPSPEKRREEKSNSASASADAPGDCESSGKKRRKSVEVAEVAIPPPLDTSEVRSALEAWLAYKRERGEGYKSARFVAGLFDGYADPSVFVASVRWSMGRNYAGLVMCRETGGGLPKPPQKPLDFSAIPDDDPFAGGSR